MPVDKINKICWCCQRGALVCAGFLPGVSCVFRMQRKELICNMSSVFHLVVLLIYLYVIQIQLSLLYASDRSITCTAALRKRPTVNVKY